MKAVISDRIYLEVLPHQQQKIDKELTYAIPSFKYGDPPLIIKNMAMIRQGLVAIPVGRLDLIPTDHEITDKRTDVWSRDFMIWKINFGLWAVAWAGLWEKRVWADYEQLLWVVFSCFQGQKIFLTFF